MRTKQLNSDKELLYFLINRLNAQSENIQKSFREFKVYATTEMGFISKKEFLEDNSDSFYEFDWKTDTGKDIYYEVAFVNDETTNSNSYYVLY